MPGGLGVIGSLSAAFAAYGGTTTALAAVLLYRLISYWAVLLAGAICYLSLWRARRVRPDFALTRDNTGTVPEIWTFPVSLTTGPFSCPRCSVIS